VNQQIQNDNLIFDQLIELERIALSQKKPITFEQLKNLQRKAEARRQPHTFEQIKHLLLNADKNGRVRPDQIERLESLFEMSRSDGTHAGGIATLLRRIPGSLARPDSPNYSLEQVIDCLRKKPSNRTPIDS